MQQLVLKCPLGLVAGQTDLQEAFLSIADLNPSTAGKLVSTLSTLFPRCTFLADRCALSLRKATFSQDEGCRQSAVAALLALLRNQVASASTLHRRLTINYNSVTPGVSPLAIDEILALLRRFMTHQSGVRTLLYDELYKLQHDYPGNYTLTRFI